MLLDVIANELAIVEFYSILSCDGLTGSDFCFYILMLAQSTKHMELIKSGIFCSRFFQYILFL